MTFLKRIVRRIRAAADAGMSTAEYAVGTVAAVGFATFGQLTSPADRRKRALAVPRVTATVQDQLEG